MAVTNEPHAAIHPQAVAQFLSDAASQMFWMSQPGQGPRHVYIARSLADARRAVALLEILDRDVQASTALPRPEHHHHWKEEHEEERQHVGPCCGSCVGVGYDGPDCCCLGRYYQRRQAEG